MPQWLYGPLAFIITFAENWVSARSRGAERQSKMAKTPRYSIFAANWAALFDLILIVDMYLSVHDFWLVVPWFLAGGWLGEIVACEQARKKFQRRVRRKRKPPVESTEGSPHPLPQ
jgi:hypothetical protein